MKNLRIVFMGSPEFAVATLGALLMNGINVVSVVTTPDKPAGRGRKMTKSAVREFADFSKLPVMQPSNLKDPAFIAELKSLNADMFIVVAFRMLPAEVWKIPALGTINLHASLLPDYRGAAPINHALINGETVTGVTTFLIDDKIDTGKILLSEEVPIFPFENAGDLHDKLMVHGARLMIKTIEEIAKNNIVPVPQNGFLKNGKSPKPAPKIHPEDCIINWNEDSVTIHNLIRGLAPYPCARSRFTSNGTTVSFKVFESEPDSENYDMKPGTILSDKKSYLRIVCRKGSLSILSLQLEGKKRMSTEEFLRGFRMDNITVPATLPA